mmetsp:Transcript_10498/g.18994  ORF Transcript_10498/g.18994 Transcript_10498/m.18994 type:complete len:200 (+) Transcript_10498:662-1261(+)
MLGAVNASCGVDTLHLLLDGVQGSLIHKVCLVQNYTVGKSNLLHTLILHTFRLLLFKMRHHMLRVHNGHNAIKLVLAADVIIHEKGLRHRGRVCQTCCLNEDGIKGLHLGIQSLQSLHQIPTDCAADASIHHLNDLFVGFLCEYFLVHTNFAKLVLNDGKAQAMVRRLQNVVHQRRLSRAKETCQNCDRDHLFLCHRSG